MDSRSLHRIPLPSLDAIHADKSQQSWLLGREWIQGATAEEAVSVPGTAQF